MELEVLEFTTIDPWVWGVAGSALLAAAILLAFFGWRRRKADQARARQEQERLRQLPAGAVHLRPGDLVLAKVVGHRQVLELNFGTLGARQGQRNAQAIVRAGGAGHIAASYLCELDQDEREAAIRHWPPALQDRLVVCDHTAFPAGLQNATFQEVLAKRRYWEHLMVADAERVHHLAYRGTTAPELAQGQQPIPFSTVLAEVSPGGHAALAIPFLRAIRQLNPHAKVYIFTVIPEDPTLREEITTMLAAYRDQGLAEGFIVLDNLTGEPAVHDLGTAVFHASLITGAWLGDRPVPGWNMLGQLFRSHPGGVATLSILLHSIPVYYRAATPPFYYTFQDQVVLAGLDGIPAVQEERRKALPLPTPAAKTRRFLYFVAPLMPPALRAAGDSIDAGLQLDAGQFSLNYISIGTNLMPTTQQALVTVVMAQLVEQGPQALEAFVKGLPQPSVAGPLPTAESNQAERPHHSTAIQEVNYGPQ